MTTGHGSWTWFWSVWSLRRWCPRYWALVTSRLLWLEINEPSTVVNPYGNSMYFVAMARHEGMICWQLLRQLQFQKSRKLKSPHQLKVRLFVTSKFQYMPEMEVLYIMSPYIDRLFRGCEFSVLGKWNLWQSPACNKVSSTLPVLDFSSGFQPQIPRSVFS